MTNSREAVLQTAAATNAFAWNYGATLHDTTARRPGPHFQWTPWPGGVPGIEVLGDLDRQRVLELGSGSGENLMVCAGKGARCMGVDVAERMIALARVKWRTLSTPYPVNWVHAEATSWLNSCGMWFDVIYSVYGAFGLCPPQDLISACHRRLLQGGLLAFSVAHRDRIPDILRGQELFADGTTLPVKRFLLRPDEWKNLLTSSGFRIVNTQVFETQGQACILVTCRRK